MNILYLTKKWLETTKDGYTKTRWHVTMYWFISPLLTHLFHHCASIPSKVGRPGDLLKHSRWNHGQETENKNNGFRPSSKLT